jgi:hypothetical protein
MKKISNRAASAHLDLAAVTGGDDTVLRMVRGEIKPKIWDEMPKKPDTTAPQPTK